MRMRARRGVAVALALFALVTIAALAHATIVPAVAFRRAVWRAAAHGRAQSAAERGIAAVLGHWRAAEFAARPVGSTWRDETTQDAAPGERGGAIAVTTRVHRLSSSAFRIESEGSLRVMDAPVVARRTLYVELRADSMVVGPALVTGGGVILGDRDSVVADPSCSDAAPQEGLVQVAPGAIISWNGGEAPGTVEVSEVAASADTYASPAGLDAHRLAADADIVLAAGAMVRPEPREVQGVCAIGPASWGEPWRGTTAVLPCTGAYPVVRADGDLRVDGGRGQGILLVSGRLELHGPFHHTGIIVAAGGIEATGGPITITGAVFTAPTTAARFQSEFTRLVASRCAAQAAADANAAVAPLPQWAWAR